MRFAILNGNTVKNVIECAPDEAPMFGAVTCPDHVGIGWVFSAGEWHPLPPTRWQSVAQAREQMRSDVKAKRDMIEADGFPFLSHVMQSDSRSVERINSAAIAARTLLASAGDVSMVAWRDEENVDVPMTASQILAMQNAMVTFGASVHMRARELQAEIKAAATLDELEAIDIDAGWPSVR
jgi:hypothetical protein